MTDTPLDKGRLSDEELVSSSDLFDADFYLATYPDVAGAKADPLKHYLGSGAKEGRDPSALFSTKAYYRRYPDVLAAGWNPLVHYLRLGEAEGRLSNPLLDDAELITSSGMFDADYYREMRPDLPDDTNVCLHYLEFGADDGTDPSEKFSTSGYMQQFPDVVASGMNPLVHYLREGLPVGRSAPPGRPLHVPVRTLAAETWPRLQPVAVVRVTGVGPRITVLTDSVGVSHLFGGVGTALILAMSLANKYGASLRIATTHDAPDPGVLRPLQQASGVTLAGDVEIAHLPYDDEAIHPLVMGERDVVITTSWWTTRSALDSTLQRDEIVYLLQEDERMFYPYGDERLMCGETLAEDLVTVVNTERLLRHLSAELPRLHEQGISFEPAFPPSRETPPAAEGGKRNFFFYSRPQNTRNLFWRGVAALERAVEDQVLDPDEWTFHFVGRGTPKLSLPFDTRPEIHEGLDWIAYRALVSSMDAGMVLMDTPHPSYPPLDLAAAGVPVLTNRHPGKDDLPAISKNIVMADLAVPSLVAGLGEVARLGADAAARRQNREADHIARDWPSTLSATLDALDARLGSRLGRGGHVH